MLGTFFVPEKVKIPCHSTPGDAKLCHEVRTIGWFPAAGTLPNHLNHAPDAVILGSRTCLHVS